MNISSKKWHISPDIVSTNTMMYRLAFSLKPRGVGSRMPIIGGAIATATTAHRKSSVGREGSISKSVEEYPANC